MPDAFDGPDGRTYSGELPATATPGQAAAETWHGRRFSAGHAVRLDEAYAHAGADWDATAEAASRATTAKLAAEAARYKAERDAARESAPVYLGTIGALAAALSEIRDSHDTGTAAHDIAHKALDDADEPQRLAAVIAGVRGERDAAREAEKVASADRERYLIALRNVARILASCAEKLTPIETVELIDDEVSALDLGEDSQPPEREQREQPDGGRPGRAELAAALRQIRDHGPGGGMVALQKIAREVLGEDGQP